jgi:hypothetical protein
MHSTDEEAETSAPGNASRRGPAAVLYILLFLTGLMLPQPLLNRVVPWRPDGQLGAKLEYLAESADRYDVVFVGASRTYRGVNPLAFDGRMADLGLESHSFNLGVQSLLLIEQVHVIDGLFELERFRPKLLVVTPDALRPQLENAIVTSQRVIAWHDLQGTRSALALVAARSSNRSLQYQWGRNHLQAFMINSSFRGQILEWVLPGGESPFLPDIAEVLGPAGTGFVPYEYDARRDNLGPGDRRRRKSFREGEPIRAQNRSQLTEPASPTAINLVQRIQERGAARGTMVAFIAMPGDEFTPNLRWLKDEGIISILFDYNHPKEHPELFDRALWWDRGHYNRKGARAFSVMLADEVYTLLSNEVP